MLFKLKPFESHFFLDKFRKEYDNNGINYKVRIDKSGVQK